MITVRSPSAIERRKEYQRQYQRARRRTPDGRRASYAAWAKYAAGLSEDRKKEIARKATFHWKLRKLDADPGVVSRLLDAGCAICGRPNELAKKRRALCIDHNHSTGKFRGILCNGCNTGLGKFRDSVEMLERAIQYLKGV